MQAFRGVVKIEKNRRASTGMRAGEAPGAATLIALDNGARGVRLNKLSPRDNSSRIAPIDPD